MLQITNSSKGLLCLEAVVDEIMSNQFFLCFDLVTVF